MGYPLGPTLADVFMSHFENIWFENGLPHLEPTMYRWFFDDTFLHFWSNSYIEKFKNYLNKQHKTFKSQIEENGSLSFLDITISHENNQFVTSIYGKPTFPGVFKNFESFIPDI